MDRIRCDNENVIQLFVFGQAAVRRDHLVVGAIAPDGVGPFGGFFQGNFWIGKQRARHDAAGAVKVNCLLVGVDDECAASPADQTDVKRFV